MASYRMIPTWFFNDPAVQKLTSHNTRLLLIWLILLADDEGREGADADWLGQKMDYSPERIEGALQELEHNGLLALSYLGQKRSYQLTCWYGWQILYGLRIPSHYPAPPCSTDIPPECA